jgi:type IV pilus assembly protein PilE
MMHAEEGDMHNPERAAHGRSSSPRLRKQAGVTLLELMIVVVVIGILSIIAIPGYREYTKRAQRTEAKAALLRLAANQERFYLQNRTYSANVDGGVGFAQAKSENGVYALTLATTGGWTLDYTATARPVAGGGVNGVDQTSDTDCQSFTINSAGVRTAAPNVQSRCW